MSVEIPVTVELFYSGAWQDITSYVYQRDRIQITRGKANEGTSADPSSCALTLNNRDGRFSPRNPSSPLYGLIGRNTPLRVKATPPGGSARTRFVGEIAALPQAWDTSGNDVYVQIQAAGIGRRLGQGQPPDVTSLRAFLAGYNGVYWPLDDNSLATFGKRLHPVNQAGLSDSQVAFKSTGTGNVYAWAAGELDSALPNTLQITNTGTPTSMLRSLGGYVGAGTSITYAYVDFLYKSSSLGLLELIVRDYLSNVWHLVFRADGLHWDVQITRDFYDSSIDGTASETIADSADNLTALTDGELHYVRFSLTESGADVAYNVFIDGTSVLSGTRVSASVGGVADIAFTYTSGDDPVSLGHVAVYTSANANVPTTADVLDVVLAYSGELAADRLTRLCADNDIAFTLVGTAADTPAMGGQGSATLLALLQECAETDIGVLYEPRDALGFAYRTRTDLYNQAAAVTLDYSANVFGAPPNPTDDDFSTRNDVTVSNTSGSGSAQATLTEGALSTQAPPDGINTYPTTASVNLETSGGLDDQANWRLHLSTVDEARYPSLTLNMLTPAISGDATLAGQIADLDVADKLTMTNLPRTPDDVSQLVLGYTEDLWQFGWTIDLNCSPASPYQVAVYGSSALGDGARYDAERATLDADCTSGATSLSVTSGRGTELWTTDAGEFPFDINIGGERITVTGIAGGDIEFVGVGTAATANNASVTPGLPAGVASGDVVYIFASIRNSGTGTVNLPANWTTLATFGNCRIFARVYDGVWTMPTVTFAGGVANADTIAQSAAFRNVALSGSSSLSQLNGSAQDIAMSAVSGGALADKDTLTLSLAWKQDDWTGAAVSGNDLGTRLIELQEATATAGDDAGQVWDYAIRGLDANGNAPAITWTITGGAAAISRALVVFLYRAAQTFTVTRSVNNIIKAHSAGDAVSLWDTPKYAL